MSKDISGEISEVLDRYGVSPKHGKKLVGDLMCVAIAFEKTMKETRIQHALGRIKEYGGIDGGHHKQWLLDQIIKILSHDYEEWVKDYNSGEDGPDTYEWDKGITP